MKKLLIHTPFAVSIALASACSVDTKSISQSLIIEKNWQKSQAECYASRLGELMDSTTFNRVSDLMAKGAEFKDAVNMARRSTGKSYSSKITNDKMLQNCVSD